LRAIEIDAGLAARLRERFTRSPQVEVVQGDALRVPLPPEPFRVLANIPFAHTTAIMRRLLDDPALPLERADLVVELDVAWKRARVAPSTALGAYWGAWWEFAITRRIDRSAFTPPPAVDAAVLRITRRAEPLVPPADACAFRKFVTAGFERRALRHALSRRELKRLAVELGFGRDPLPGELDQHQWAGVFRYVRRGSIHSRRHEPL
jgi:23S rRNA (adenine-N6)-dimethyltransferase